MPVQNANKATTKKVTAPKQKSNEDATTALTIAGAEHEPANRPDSFKALKPNELAYAADLFAVDNDGPPEVILANLEAEGVTWNMYARQMKLPGWEELPEEEEPEPIFVEDWDEDEEGDEEVTDEVITALPMQNLNEGKYLIKFVGQNWYFERGRHTFSKEKPYALMTARDAQSALVDEPTKFRQAFPAELEEFYS